MKYSLEDILQEIQSLAGLLARAGLLLGTAESCTGGILSSWITSLPGSSRFFAGGVCSYSNALKTRLLGVEPGLIAKHGAVSREVVIAMASGARKSLGVDWALSTSGIAGPDGGTPEKPVGTVWCGVAGPGGVDARQLKLVGDRGTIREESAMLALRFLKEKIV